jgi:hypothetical protein
MAVPADSLSYVTVPSSATAALDAPTIVGRPTVSGDTDGADSKERRMTLSERLLGMDTAVLLDVPVKAEPPAVSAILFSEIGAALLAITEREFGSPAGLGGEVVAFAIEGLAMSATAMAATLKNLTCFILSSREFL